MPRKTAASTNTVCRPWGGSFHKDIFGWAGAMSDRAEGGSGPASGWHPDRRSRRHPPCGRWKPWPASTIIAFARDNPQPPAGLTRRYANIGPGSKKPLSREPTHALARPKRSWNGLAQGASISHWFGMPATPLISDPLDSNNWYAIAWFFFFLSAWRWLVIRLR